MYLDDSDGNSGSQKFRVWGGLIADETLAIKLQDDLAKLKIKWGLKKSDPIKWSPKENKNLYSAQRKIRDQTEFKCALLDLIGQSDATLIAAVFETKKGLS